MLTCTNVRIPRAHTHAHTHTSIHALRLYIHTRTCTLTHRCNYANASLPDMHISCPSVRFLARFTHTFSENKSEGGDMFVCHTFKSHLSEQLFSLFDLSLSLSLHPHPHPLVLVPRGCAGNPSLHPLLQNLDDLLRMRYNCLYATFHNVISLARFRALLYGACVCVRMRVRVFVCERRACTCVLWETDRQRDRPQVVLSYMQSFAPPPPPPPPPHSQINWWVRRSSAAIKTVYIEYASLFVGCNRLVHLRDGSAQTILRAATLR